MSTTKLETRITRAPNTGKFFFLANPSIEDHKLRAAAHGTSTRCFTCSTTPGRTNSFGTYQSNKRHDKPCPKHSEQTDSELLASSLSTLRYVYCKNSKKKIESNARTPKTALCFLQQMPSAHMGTRAALALSFPDPYNSLKGPKTPCPMPGFYVRRNSPTNPVVVVSQSST
jgi:hypothetical protein